MTARSILLTSLLSAGSIWLFAAAPALGQAEQVVPDVANSKFQFAAEVTADSVAIRSGPGDNYYPTVRLNKGASIQVVGKRFEWLKVVPPEGSFSVVARAFITKSPDGKTGRVIGDTLNVRAGSSVTNLKVTVQCKLAKDAVVQIIGEQDEYYMIKPPADAFVYIHEKLARPVRLLNAPANPAAVGAGNVGINPTTHPPATQPSNIAIAPATRPAATQPSLADATAEQHRPKVNLEAQKAEADFDKLETTYTATIEGSLESLPSKELILGYETLVKSEYLSPAMRRVAERRLIVLKVKDVNRDDLLAVRKAEAERAAKLAVLRADRDAILVRLGQGQNVYTAVGKLTASTVNIGQTPLLRLVDPNTDRTLCYVRSDDPKISQLMNQFIGVRGELANDPQISLRIVSATEFGVIDPAAVGNGVSAQITPPSLLPAAKDGKPGAEAKTE